MPTPKPIIGGDRNKWGHKLFAWVESLVGETNDDTVTLVDALDVRVATNEGDISDLTGVVATKADQADLDGVVSDLSDHEADTANPHTVTKSQVGLANVPNTDATLRSNHTGTQTASTISDFASAVEGLSVVTTLQSDVSTLQSDLGTAESDIDVLESDMSTAQSDIGTLQSNVGSLSSGKADLIYVEGIEDQVDDLNLFIRMGAGDPNSAVIADIGAIFLRTDGGAGTTLYVKESGMATDTGWVAVTP